MASPRNSATGWTVFGFFLAAAAGAASTMVVTAQLWPVPMMAPAQNQVSSISTPKPAQQMAQSQQKSPLVNQMNNTQQKGPGGQTPPKPGLACDTAPACKCRCAYDNPNQDQTDIPYLDADTQTLCDAWSLDHCEDRNGDVCEGTGIDGDPVTGFWVCNVEYVSR